MGHHIKEVENQFVMQIHRSDSVMYNKVFMYPNGNMSQVWAYTYIRYLKLPSYLLCNRMTNANGYYMDST